MEENKCVCGYHYRRFWDKEEYSDIGDQEFITIHSDSTFHISTGFLEIKSVTLKACPKCNTVQMS